MEDADRSEFPNAVTLTAPGGSVRTTLVPEWGGLIASLTTEDAEGPREWLFRRAWFAEAHPPDLRGGIPLLFPVCGRLEHRGEAERFRFGERAGGMPIHGFAWTRPWSVDPDSTGPDRATLILQDDETTRAMYPYRFRVALTVHCLDEGLDVILEVENRDTAPLPYSAGFHPYFVTPEAGAGKDEVRIHCTPGARLLYNERLTGIEGTGPALVFPCRATDPELNESLHELSRAGIEMRYPDGARLILTEHPMSGAGPMQYPYLQCYTMPGEGFFCPEPLMNPPNTINEDPGRVHVLAPGEGEKTALHLRPALPGGERS